MTRLAKGKGSNGHSSSASADYCNMSDPAFDRGLRDAGYVPAAGAAGAELGPRPTGDGGTQKGRFGGTTNYDKAGTMSERSNRSGN